MDFLCMRASRSVDKSPVATIPVPENHDDEETFDNPDNLLTDLFCQHFDQFGHVDCENGVRATE